MYTKLESEKRAVTEEEEKQIKEIQEQINGIDKTISVLDSVKKSLAESAPGNDGSGEGKGEGSGSGEGGDGAAAQRAQAEEKSFAEYLRGAVNGELRADGNITLTDNGAVVPTSIANKIIEKIYDICPILQRSTKYNIKGNLTIPYYPVNDNDIEMAYADEFTELTAKKGDFGSITMSGYLAGLLVKISRSLINNSQFDIVSFFTSHMASVAAIWIEGELLNGTSGKITGLSTAQQGITAASATAITADELIDLQDAIKDAYQKKAIWIMAGSTRTALRKLKDNNGRYLLQDDITSAFGTTLLGKPVYVSDNMPEMAAGARAIYYGDMSGLATKMTEQFELQVLREHYATQHAVGIVGWTELDSKIENEQKIAVLTMGG